MSETNDYWKIGAVNEDGGKTMIFERTDKRNTEVKTYTSQEFYNMLAVCYGVQTAAAIMKNFREGRKKEFVKGPLTYRAKEEVAEQVSGKGRLSCGCLATIGNPNRRWEWCEEHKDLPNEVAK